MAWYFDHKIYEGKLKGREKGWNSEGYANIGNIVMATGPDDLIS